MTLTNADITELTALRRLLHQHPEVSGQEQGTAGRITDALLGHSPDRLLTGLGGHGVAAVYQGQDHGPTILFRCELDALPITEQGNLPHRSTVPGTGHLCGHDGHMTVLLALARLLSRQRPARGRVVLLFQPAEETGAGAEAVLSDPDFETISPDYAFALHNMPGLPLGHVGLIPGPVNCASRGMAVTLTGKSAHASEPENGRSPMHTLAHLMPALTALSHGTPQDRDFTLATVTHAQMGAPAFGIAPGDATFYVTLCTLTDGGMQALCDAATTLVMDTATAQGLTTEITYHDIFAHCENHPEATLILRRALDALQVPHDGRGLPMRASEDFGRFGHRAKAAMLFLGAGTAHAALHNPDYDFPDDLIPIGARIFHQVARDMLG
ncbi:amidohydrolase [uncultured Roseovarius sp.]|uniref:amidohydrolase n=1 Tax=uncultured Roseovarius sp. TaxID=293344 RepID=UPI000C50A547|nr:peptidase M20 [Roseovarius sp.]MBD11411.1 peptidase M20 [Roseovarius sp.]|tara:strand:+ start:753 stop:1901 length:1149 start_codon:yes stop_codon:yes gene_type:complete